MAWAFSTDGSRVYFVFGRKPWGTMAELAAAPMAMMHSRA